MPKRPRSIHRRRFLQGAGLATLAAALSACGLDNDLTPTAPASDQPGGRLLPTSSTTPSATPSPSREATSTPTATPTRPGDPFDSPFQSPIEPSAPPTATQPPTATPTPSATPTPPPTPFPAGPPTRLGLFVAWYHPQIMELIDTGNVTLLKTLELDPNFLAEVKARSPQTVVVGRVTLGQIGLGQVDTAVEARRAADAVRAEALDARRAGLIDAWEGFNEPVPGNEDEMRRLADLEAERARLLAADGLRAVIGNFGTGQPPLEWWPAFRPALEAGRQYDAYLGLHEYAAPTIWYHTNRDPLDFRAAPGDEGWLTLRYRKVYRQFLQPWGLALPLLITECGVDGLVADRPGPAGKGWKDFAAYWNELGMGLDTPGNYVEQLAWYDSELQLDDYVAGAAVFAMTAFQEWDSYQLLGDAASILGQYLSVHPLR